MIPSEDHPASEFDSDEYIEVEYIDPDGEYIHPDDGYIDPDAAPPPEQPLIALTPEQLKQLIMLPQAQVQAQVEAQMRAEAEAQMRAEAEAVSSEIQTTALTSLIFGAVAMVIGAAAGVTLFAYLYEPPITEDISGTITFGLFGLALPFGWHATRPRDSIVIVFLPGLTWLIMTVLRAWFSIVIGIPAMLFYLLRALVRLSRARRLRAAATSPLFE